MHFGKIKIKTLKCFSVMLVLPIYYHCININHPDSPKLKYLVKCENKIFGRNNDTPR